MNIGNFAQHLPTLPNKVYQPGDAIQSSIYDITVNSNTKPATKNQAVLVIDSADRDHTLYPNPNRYKIQLKNGGYRDVIMVELKYAQIPNSAYIINESNNKLYYQDCPHQTKCCEYSTVEIPIGNWPADCNTGPSIRSNLEDALNECSDSEYVVEFDPHVRKFTIEQVCGSGYFNLIFCGGLSKTGLGGTMTRQVMGVDKFCYPEIPTQQYQNEYIAGTVGHVLGFKPMNLTGCIKYQGQISADMNTGRFVVLKIRNMERIDSNNSNIDKAFCVIGMDDGVNNFIFTRGFDFINNETYTKNFNPPLGKLEELDIEILNSNGKPYDFNGRDHLLMFDILSLTRFDNF